MRSIWLFITVLLAHGPAAAFAQSAPAAPTSRSAPPTQSTPPPVLFAEDFERDGPLLRRWEADGRVRAARITLEGDSPIDGVWGRALSIRAAARTRIHTKPLEHPPAFADCDTLLFRINAVTATRTRPEVFEFRFYEADRPAWWWRRISVDAPGWREIRVPLRFFRQSRGAAPAWESVDRFGLHFRSDAEVLIDGIELIGGPRPAAAYLSTAQLAELAFGTRRTIHTFEREPFVVLTDSANLDGEALLDALLDAFARLRADFPNLPQPTRPAPLLIFATRADYQAFFPHFAERFANSMVPPVSGGFTATGVSASYCRDESCGVRPVFVHEALHALLEQVLGLGNASEWVHEGLATRYQLAFSKQDIRSIIRNGLDDANARTPLARLCDGGAIPETRYWQAAVVIEWLVDDPDRKTRFERILKQMRRRTSTDLRPLVERHLKMTLEEMDAAWLAWARQRYGK